MRQTTERYVKESRLHVRLDGKPLAVEDYLSTRGRKWQRMEDVKGVVHRMNEANTAWGMLKRGRSNREFVINVKCLYDGVIVPIALYGTEAWAIRSAEQF